MSSVKRKGFPTSGPPRSGSGSNEQSRSVFHTKLPSQLDKEHDECLAAMTSYIQALQQLCGAGSHVAAAFIKLLKDTAFEEIAEQFQTMMARVETMGAASSKQTNTDIERLWTQMGQSDDNVEGSHSNELAAKSLTCFLQMQCQFFQTSTDLLKQMASSPSQDPNGGQSTQAKSPRPATSNRKPPLAKGTEATKGATNSTVDSPNSLRKHLSSFFKLGSKSSTSTGSDVPAQSLFYVDLASEGDGHLSAGQRVASDGLVNAVGAINLQSGGDAAQPEVVAFSTNGQIATQEELDSVIDFLSRGPRPNVGMEAIPENQPPVMSRAVGSQLSQLQGFYPPQQHAVNMGVVAPQRPQSHFQPRLSEGLLTEPVTRDVRTNTWPIKPSQRHTFGQDLAQMMQMYGGVFENLPLNAEADYTQYLSPMKPAKLAGPEVLPGNSSGVWAPGGDIGLQRMWQYSSMPADRPEGAGKVWPTVPDSSSCSDESSSNGEVPWMMGVDLAPGIKKGRRHSSAEEVVMPETMAPPPETRSSTLDSKTTNTWPPKQVWAGKQPADGSTGLNNEQVMTSDLQQQKNLLNPSPHRPLTPQWSDPLLNKPLSVWDPGLSGGVSQPSLPTHPADGANLTPRPVPPPRQRQHDRKFC